MKTYDHKTFRSENDFLSFSSSFFIAKFEEIRI